MDEQRRAFVLTREARKHAMELEFIYWCWTEQGPARLRFTGQRAVFYVRQETHVQAGVREPSALQSLTGSAVDALWFSDLQTLRAEAKRLSAQGAPTYEADVKPADRFLMERMITGPCQVQGAAVTQPGFSEFVNPALSAAELTPRLRVLSFDVEAEGPRAPVLSIGCVIGAQEQVFVRGEGPAQPGVHYCNDEPATLRAFLAYVSSQDPDVLIGWNVIEFDMAYLEQRCHVHRIPYALGRGRERARVLRGEGPQAPAVALTPGRVVLDGIATMRAATWSFERWSLEHVARSLLGRGKAIDKGAEGNRLQEILRMYRDDLPRFIEYNLEDCRLVRDIFERAQLLEFAVERQRLTGLTMDRRAGAVAAFDYLYLPRLHRRGRVAPSTGHRGGALESPGGYVMDSVPGLYRNVLVLDFKSLYPSLIRTFLVDPLGLATADEDGQAVPGYDGARFHREQHILPELIEALWEAREQAKARGDAAMQRAIKIQMNSFYGVLGTPACRFFDGRLASSITRRGHEVLRKARGWIEAEGHQVLYGDTDSLFVWVGEAHDEAACVALGERLVAQVNRGFQEELRALELQSHLELQFEACYSRFLMPTTRHSDTGSKKRYAGLVGERLVIKGLEAVRTDWTPLARTLQRELLLRVFTDQPYRPYIEALTQQLYRGELDDQLIYRKRLRQAADAYTRNVPPHVVAARKLSRPVRVVEYVMTRGGAEPVEHRSAPLDYDHYLKTQLAPVANVVLSLLGSDFMRLGGRQLSLFD